MFGNRYFVARYFPDRYFPPGGASVSEPLPDPGPLGTFIHNELNLLERVRDLFQLIALEF